MQLRPPSARRRAFNAWKRPRSLIPQASEILQPAPEDHPRDTRPAPPSPAWPHTGGITHLDLPRGRAAPQPDLWAHAEKAYRTGASAPDICSHYGLSLSTFRHRAKREGWRRGDFTADPGAYHLDDDTVHETLDAAALAEAAWRAASEAVRTGRLRQAQGWTRLARELRLQAAAEREARERADRFAPRPAVETVVEAAPKALKAPVPGAAPAGRA